MKDKKVADIIQKIQFFGFMIVYFALKPMVRICIFLILALSLVSCQGTDPYNEPTCSSRIISLVPKTMKYHNQINNTKELSCKSASLPPFATLDERCYLIISPSTTGDFHIQVNMTVTDKKPTGVQTSWITLPYILTITKIRYNGPSQQEVQYDISLNRVINLEAPSTSWLVKPGQQFFAQFTVNQTPKLYERIYFEFINLPNGLIGNQLNGVIEGNVQVPPGYYSFAVRVFDLQGNSETLQTTMLVHDDRIPFNHEDFEDEETLKFRLDQVNKKIADNSIVIANAKQNIQKKLQSIATARADLTQLNSQKRRLEGTQNSLSFAMNFTKNNLEIMKKRFQSSEKIVNDYNLIVNDAKRTYQTLVFGIQEKQSVIEKEQLEADRRFQLYLEGDKGYNRVRIDLDDCERKNEAIANDAMRNLKELDRANFVQNLYDIIQGK